MLKRGIQYSIANDGFAVLKDFAAPYVVESLLCALKMELAGDRAGTRHLHQRIPAVVEFLRCEQLNGLIDELLPGGFLVRSVFFDKTPEKNWRVPWHQDLSICVAERRDVPGFSAWSVKEAVQHVQPPVALLEKMLTVRLHLDDCGDVNGPLRVIPGSHDKGRLSPGKIAELRRNNLVQTCVVPRGGAVIMKPLLLHSSSPAISPTHRRVLHLEFASDVLPKPLEWAL